MSDWSSAINMLGLRQQRRQSSRDRLHGAMSDLGGQLHESREAEKHRGFLGEESELDRIFRGTESAADRTHAMDLAELGEEGADRRQIRGHEHEVQENDLKRMHDETMQGMADKAALERITAQADQRIREHGAVDEMYRTHYEDGPRTWTDPTTGRRYTWRSNQEFDLVMRKLAEDLISDRQALASAGIDDTASWFEAYMRVRDTTMADYGEIWDGQNWLGIPDEERRKQIMADFRNNVGMMIADGSLPEEWADEAVRMFEEYLDRASMADEGEAGEPGGGIAGFLEELRKRGVNEREEIMRFFAESPFAAPGQMFGIPTWAFHYGERIGDHLVDWLRGAFGVTDEDVEAHPRPERDGMSEADREAFATGVRERTDALPTPPSGVATGALGGGQDKVWQRVMALLGMELPEMVRTTLEEHRRALEQEGSLPKDAVDTIRSWLDTAERRWGR